ncbi:MAG: hypothetical protein PWR24_642 [Desulfonauticus sp.]|jgi:hypothetical protein|nr:MAG: hypothetical protein XD41_0436 [Desulfonauticus sp. 38_4375]MDK2921085.1 hypothetical protein [Desulfonauticus sp.]
MSFSSRAYLLLPRRDIAYFKFLIEAWDNLAYLTVIDKYKAVIELNFSKEYKNKVLKVLEAIQKEIELKILYLKEE